mgnify:CR=1 FL=1
MHNDDRKIKEKLQQKTWNEIKTNDSWAIFKIMAEFVDGYEKLSKIGPCVSIFGSARTKTTDPYYGLAEEVAFKLTQNGYGVITGGGPGIMEAANQGAKEAKGKTVGLGISLPFEQTNNKWITKGLNFVFHYFFMRKFWFLYLTKGIVVWPGGLGTLDEFFEILTLLQTKKISRKIPIVLFGKDFWDGLIDWDKLISNNVISKTDLDLFVILNSVDETFDYLIKYMDN